MDAKASTLSRILGTVAVLACCPVLPNCGNRQTTPSRTSVPAADKDASYDRELNMACLDKDLASLQSIREAAQANLLKARIDKVMSYGVESLGSISSLLSKNVDIDYGIDLSTHGSTITGYPCFRSVFADLLCQMNTEGSMREIYALIGNYKSPKELEVIYFRYGTCKDRNVIARLCREVPSIIETALGSSNNGSEYRRLIWRLLDAMRNWGRYNIGDTANRILDVLNRTEKRGENYIRPLGFLATILPDKVVETMRDRNEPEALGTIGNYIHVKNEEDLRQYVVFIKGTFAANVFSDNQKCIIIWDLQGKGASEDIPSRRQLLVKLLGEIQSTEKDAHVREGIRDAMARLGEEE